ncbi:hypothetical protein PFISCL1PPCAC_10171, partial [Pristionchus fissidentatus]
LLFLFPLLGSSSNKYNCHRMAINMKEGHKALKSFSNIECPLPYCVHNITHTDGHMWLIGGCGTLECKSRIDGNSACIRGSAIEKTHPSLYQYSCCCNGQSDHPCDTKAIDEFYSRNSSSFLMKTASQSLPREEIKTVVYVRTGVAALFAIAAIATQVVAVRLYRKPAKQ